MNCNVLSPTNLARWQIKIFTWLDEQMLNVRALIFDLCSKNQDKGYSVWFYLDISYLINDNLGDLNSLLENDSSLLWGYCLYVSLLYCTPESFTFQAFINNNDILNTSLPHSYEKVVGWTRERQFFYNLLIISRLFFVKIHDGQPENDHFCRIFRVRVIAFMKIQSRD